MTLGIILRFSGESEFPGILDVCRIDFGSLQVIGSLAPQADCDDIRASAEGVIAVVPGLDDRDIDGAGQGVGDVEAVNSFTELIRKLEWPYSQRSRVG